MKGNIEKRGEQSWRLTIDLGELPNGKRDRRRKTITINDKSLLRTTKKLQDYLEDQLAAFKVEIESGEYIQPSKFLFENFVEQKYSIHVNKLSPNTIKTYNAFINKHMITFFRGKQMENIKTLHCVDFMESIKGYSISVQQCCHSILKSIFTKAQQWQVIKSNPMNGVDRPKGNNRSTKYYDAEQASKALMHLQTEPIAWRLYFTACMIGGFRRGELLALQWSDIDFEKQILHIDKSLASGQVTKAPKNNKSRSVKMPKWFMDELERFKTEWIAEKDANMDIWQGGNHEYVFHDGLGKSVHITSPSHRWKRFTKRNNLPDIRLHDLRHTSATLLLEEGVSLKVIQERHGHTDFQTTANIYSHVTKKLSDEAADKLEKFRPQFAPK
ncbi:site-specific integrase [Paenibacillus sp. D2_2]|uniref:tyrosine-type recombinase/integrase n=1 Tax=Paenibacillus sp. D2_2 TaxID=3073092 RepID=UPI002814AC99|nr:site-specific integrase [Paenibacillus sp. D2_2]WMT42793.1 site-specific integrase [Paenibacillus sp. D2_2]